MFKRPNTNVTAVAKQATDSIGLGIMVHMKVTTAVWCVCIADCATSSLLRKQLIISAKRQAICVAKMIVFSAARVLVAPFFRMYPQRFKMITSPFRMQSDRASSTVNRIAMGRSRRLEKAFQRQVVSAFRTAFEPVRQIERSPLHWNVSYG